MKCVVVTHKKCWRSQASPSGYATRGGFPQQMETLAEMFDETVILMTLHPPEIEGERPLSGHNLSIVPLPRLTGRGLWRRVKFVGWLARNTFTVLREMRKADAVHAPVPGEMGTVGMALALLLRKPLFVRHCGNWMVQETFAEKLWKWAMERFAGGRNVMLATGGRIEPPSQRNPNVRWIFSTSLSRAELQRCAISRENDPRVAPRLILACRQEESKGTGRVIESLPLVLKEFPAAKLDVVGNGSALPKFKKRVAELGLEGKVQFHGEVGHAEVIRCLQNADLYVYPTEASEGFPKSVLEAMACGLPVVTTKVSVLPLLISGGGGVLLENTSPQAVADAVVNCLRDPEKYKTMSQKAIETASGYSRENWSETVGAWLREAWGQPLRRATGEAGR